MKFDNVLKEATIFAKKENDFIYMLNPDAKGQKPPGVEVKKTMRVHH